eukprot:scaffold48791_cov59-Phaeocystis_antarctica.AAC.7
MQVDAVGLRRQAGAHWRGIAAPCSRALSAYRKRIAKARWGARACGDMLGICATAALVLGVQFDHPTLRPARLG